MHWDAHPIRSRTRGMRLLLCCIAVLVAVASADEEEIAATPRPPAAPRDPVKLVAEADREFRNGVAPYESAMRLYGEALALAPSSRTYYAVRARAMESGAEGAAQT